MTVPIPISLWSIAILGAIPLLAIPYALYVVLIAERPYPGIPLVDGTDGLTEAKKRFMANSRKVVLSAVSQGYKVCQVSTDVGPKILLHPTYMDEVKNNKALSFIEFVKNDLLTDVPGFDAFHTATQGEVFLQVVRMNLTQSLGSLTEGLSSEADLVLARLFPVAPDWTSTGPIGPKILELVSQLSARVFLGEPLCRNQEWLHISADFTVATFKAVFALRKYPPFLRRVVRHFVPEYKEMQSLMISAYNIIEPELQRRRTARREQVANGGKPVGKPIDSLQWIDDVAAAYGERYNTVLGQLGLTIAAIHTTSNALMNILFDIIAHPDLLAELRKEIIDVMGQESVDRGLWKKTTLYKLRLLDSVMKESQRMNPGSIMTMRRVATQTVKLSDGTTIPKGGFVAFPTTTMQDEAVYPNSGEFDGHRFLRLREQPGSENKWQFVTTSPQHFVFGHGMHACPGRFFASNEIKIALVHLLMKYDWKFAGSKQGVEGRPGPIVRVDVYSPDPRIQLMYKGRTPEIKL